MQLLVKIFSNERVKELNLIRLSRKLGDDLVLQKGNFKVNKKHFSLLRESIRSLLDTESSNKTNTSEKTGLHNLTVVMITTEENGQKR